ncbi:MAG TPA: glycosyltransferase family 1 protein [Candidatus Saccharimonadales bacterium]|nr:glycosyltransferase family 1 protein [Candidatus Saccharimonadales bacterium]
MGRIVYDVTQLAHLTGRITGIPRVIDELAKGFNGLNDQEVVFAVWVKELQEMCEIDYDQTILQHKGLVYKHIGDGSSTKQHAVPSSETRATSVAQVRLLAKRVVKKGLRMSGKVNQGLAEKLEAKAKATYMQSYLKVDFKKGDYLFIPWGEWWDPRFTDRVVRAHDEQKVKIIQVIHDVGPTVWPQFFEQVAVSPTIYNCKVIPRADLVLCVSQNTKKELIEWLKSEKIHAPRVEVIRLGDSVKLLGKPEIPHEESFKKSGLKGGDFILCVGTIEAKKNHYLFYYVYKLAKQRGIKLPKLVILGRRGFHTDEMYDMMTRDPAVKDDFVFLHDASDEEMAWAYNNCLFTALASFHEGWGIPIAESVSRGVPCMCSNTSSMVEIAEGKGVAHFSPMSSDECLTAMVKWLDNPKELAKARAATKKYKPTSWQDTFAQVKKYMEI